MKKLITAVALAGLLVAPSSADAQLARYCSTGFELCYNVTTFDFVTSVNQPNGGAFSSTATLGFNGFFDGSQAPLYSVFITQGGFFPPIPDLWAGGLWGNRFPEIFGSAADAGFQSTYAVFSHANPLPDLAPFTATDLGDFRIDTSPTASFDLSLVPGPSVVVPTPRSALLILTGVLGLGVVVARRRTQLVD